MQEIKMHNAEKQKRWGWEFLQVKLFKLRIKSLSLEQWQSVGGNFINQMKDILVSFLSAKLVLMEIYFRDDAFGTIYYWTIK
jgi:ATP-binding cassette subfamily B protein